MLTACLLALFAAPPARVPAPFIVRPAAGLVTQAGEPARAAFLVLNPDAAAGTRSITFTCQGGAVEPATLAVTLKPHESRVVSARVTLPSSSEGATLRASAGGSGAATYVRRGVDLAFVPWKRKLTPRAAGLDAKWTAPDLDDAAWATIHPPMTWEENDYAWCRVHFRAPAEWKGKRVRFVAGAVDDNDVTYLNGREIGRTNGWDTPRDYTLPADAIRWDADNVLTVMVDNPTYGGGLYKAPLFIIVGDGPVTAPIPAKAEAVARPKPGRIGQPLPLRRLTVKDGVLRYPDGAEVCLWGVNTYPQSWYQFDNMKKLGVDMHATLHADLDHLQKMGIEAIRIHVFDREISDKDGNLVRNEHLDLLDDLIGECSRRGIYLYFTPIAWWGGPNQRADAFSTLTSKPGMMFVPWSMKSSSNYLRNFLNHTIPATGRALKDEPCLCLLEVMNEPAYFVYDDIRGSVYGPQGEAPEVIARDRAELLAQWQAWLRANSLDDSPLYFPLFRYQLMSAYIRTMIGAIRSTGAKQPVAISYFGTNGDDIVQAIADSECDAITTSAYPGGWGQVNDGHNLIPAVPAQKIPDVFARKARLAYEFDTPATNTSAYLYPVIAAMFRNAEVQVACQFQYDSISTAKWNTDWGAHWLNWLYTPAKTASFMVGRETFHSQPRGVAYNPAGDEMRFGPTLASFRRNLSLYVAPDLVVHSATIPDDLAASLPTSPRRIVGVGFSPYVAYDGNGIYTLTVSGDTAELEVNPDQKLVGNSLYGSFEHPAAELVSDIHPFLLKLPGWHNARCVAADGKEQPRTYVGWTLAPGRYRITKQ